MYQIKHINRGWFIDEVIDDYTFNITYKYVIILSLIYVA